MVYCRGRNFIRRRKCRVFTGLLLACVVACLLLDWTFWTDKALLADGSSSRQRTTLNMTELLWEGLSQLDKLNEQRSTLIEHLRNITKMGNVSENMIGPWMSQLRPMAAVQYPVENTSELLSCKEIAEIQTIRSLGTGYTKVVELGRYRGQDVAVKRVKSTVKDVTTCKRRQEEKRWHECYLFANYKILKEVLMQRQLRHPNIVKLLGYCIRSEQIADSLAEHGVVVVTEVGSVFNMKVARKLTWKKRLKTAIDIASLLDYLEHSPIGSLAVPDFKTQQFVWIGDSVKLTDMDDVSSVEQTCTVNLDCRIDNKDVGIPCANGVCRGLNAKHNMNAAFKLILQHMLVHDGSYGTEILSLREEMRQLTLSAATLHSKLQHLLQQE